MDILARVVQTRKEGQESYKEEDMILPRRFHLLLKGDRLPIIIRYSGKLQTKCGTKTYYNVQFIKTNNKLQNVSLMQ